MKFGSFTTTATAPLEAVEKLIPSFLQKINERFEYYRPLFRSRSIEVCAQNGGLASVKFTLSPNPEAQKDHFISKQDVTVEIPGIDVENAIKTSIKQEVEGETGATVEISEPKWISMNIPYKEGALGETNKDVVTVKCIATFNKQVQKVGDASSNGTHKAVEKNPVELSN